MDGQSVHENRIYSVNIHCADDYPDNPPSLQFVSKINLPCVDPRSGKVRLPYLRIPVKCLFTDLAQVDPTKLPCLAQWKRDYTMETILLELRRYSQTNIWQCLSVLSNFKWSGTCHYLNTKSSHSHRKARPSKETIVGVFIKQHWLESYGWG
jgi:hypothetical protein